MIDRSNDDPETKPALHVKRVLTPRAGAVRSRSVIPGGQATAALVTAAALVCIGCGQRFESGPPTDGLVLWLTADRGVTKQTNAVSEWDDQSHHTNALQISADLRPTFDPGAFGGMGALVFDGENDYLKLDPGFADFTNGLSFFSTFALDRDDSCTAVLEMSNGSEIDDIDFGRYNGQTLFEVFDMSQSGNNLDVGTPQLYTVVQHPDQSVEMRVNGSSFDQPVTIDLPANVKREQDFVGNTLYSGCNVFGGRIGEILLYDRAVSDREVLDIETYLGTHAGCCNQ